MVMRLEGSTVLILGGSGLVGHAVARRLLGFRPARLVLVALREPEVRRAAEELRRRGAGDVSIDVAWGDVFLPAELAQMDRAAIAADSARRAALVADLFGDFTEDVLRRSLFFQLLDRHRPDAVVDCLNTATAFAYQNVYQSIQDLLAAARRGGVTAELAERHVLTLPLPQLIRHLQIASEAFQRTDRKSVV